MQVKQMVPIKPCLKLSQMLRGSFRSSDMQLKGGSGNAVCISGLFMGALGSMEGNTGPATGAAPRLYALMNLPLKKRDIRDRILPSPCDASLSSCTSWKT